MSDQDQASQGGSSAGSIRSPHIEAVKYATAYVVPSGRDETPFERAAVQSVAQHWLAGYFAANPPDLEGLQAEVSAPQLELGKEELARRDGSTASGPTGSSRSPQPADSDVVLVVPPFQHPGYIVRRAKPRPFVDDEPTVDWEAAAWFAGKARNLRALRSRFRAGDSAEELAADYRLPIEWVGRVVRPGFDLLSGDDGPDWEPMETAPKDGRDVLVALPTGVDVANWQEEKPDGTECGVVVDPGLPEGWYGYLGLCPWDKEQPSHWMPLPESPRLVPAGATPIESSKAESAHKFETGGEVSAPQLDVEQEKDVARTGELAEGPAPQHASTDEKGS